MKIPRMNNAPFYVSGVQYLTSRLNEFEVELIRYSDFKTMGIIETIEYEDGYWVTCVPKTPQGDDLDFFRTESPPAENEAISNYHKAINVILTQETICKKSK